MYALKDLTDAGTVTTRYLGELGVRGWLKLGLVVLFLSGLGGSVGYAFNVPFGAESLASVDDRALLYAGAGAFAVLAVFQYLAAILEFVFLESLRSSELHVRRYARANLKRALWLVVLRVGLLAALLVPVAGVVLATGDSPAAVDPEAIVSMLEANLGVVVAGGLGALVCWGAANTLTNAFVAPIMLHEDRGPFGAVGRFASAMGSNLLGTVGFLAIAWSIGFLVWSGLTVIGFFVMIFGGIAVIFVAALVTAVHPSLDVLGLVAMVSGLLAYQYAMALVQAPVMAYVRYYALLILGDTDSSLDLIPEERRAVRAGGGAEAGTVDADEAARVAWADDRDDESRTDSTESAWTGADRGEGTDGTQTGGESSGDGGSDRF